MVRVCVVLSSILASFTFCLPAVALSQQRPDPNTPGDTSSRSSQDSLKFINNPGGGQVVYGSLSPQPYQAAMGFMLRQVHGHFGDRPQVGKFVRAKDGSSVATFFTVNAKAQGGASKPVTGMVIVAIPRSGAQAMAAVLYDDSARFSKTQPVMLNSLNEAWHREAQQFAASQPAAESGPAAPSAQTLRQTTAGDGSASIGLAPGWRITNVAGGYLSAVGPNGEAMDIAGMFQQIHDPRSMQGMPYGGGAGPMLVAPIGGDLFSAYSSIVNQVRQSKGKPPVTFHLISSQKVGPQAIQAFYQVDLLDGKGMRKGNVRLDAGYTPGTPTWALTVTNSSAPESVFAAQNPVMTAMYKTYSQDRSVIGREQQVVMNGIKAAGERSKEEGKLADERREASSAAFNQHMDDLDRSSKSFQNYQLDRSQLQDNANNTRGTIDYLAADALVKADPDRFEIITRPDFIKGVDY
jgi:hypothetical protein